MYTYPSAGRRPSCMFVAVVIGRVSRGCVQRERLSQRPKRHAHRNRHVQGVSPAYETPTPKDHHMALNICYCRVLGGGVF